MIDFLVDKESSSKTDICSCSWSALIRQSWCIAKKDLILEKRTCAIAGLFGLFGILTMLAIALALPIQQNVSAGVGALWVSLLFGVLLSLGRSFQAETEYGAFTYLQHAPVPPLSIFAGKLMAHFAIYLALGSLLTVVAQLLFSVPFDGRFIHLLGVSAIGLFGLCCVCTLVATMSMVVKGHSLLFPLLALPLSLPLLIAAVKASATLYGAAESWASIQFLVVYAFLFLVAGSILFQLIVEE